MSKRNRVRHIKTGILGTADAEDEHGNVAVDWDNRTIVTTPREDLVWLEDLDDEIPFDVPEFGSVAEQEELRHQQRQMIVNHLCLLSHIAGPESALIERAFTSRADDEWLDLAEAVTGAILKRRDPVTIPF